jgi:hypothetical protein
MVLKRIFLFAIFCVPAIVFGQDKFSPSKKALSLFNHYKSVIEKNNDSIIVQDPQIIVGDLNGDNLPDCILSFVMTPKEGGNMIVGHECVIYLNTGKGMKVLGAFPHFKFCYGIDYIKDGMIFIKQYECAPPYNTFLKESRLYFRNGKIMEMQ